MRIIRRMSIATAFLTTTIALTAQTNYTIVPLNVPGVPAGSALASGINDFGEIVGYTEATSATTTAQAFVLVNGKYIKFSFTGATGTEAFGINNHGEIVGTYADTVGSHGFVVHLNCRDQNATKVPNPLIGFKSINAPNVVGGTSATGINDRHEIVGRLTKIASGLAGFQGFLDEAGTFTFFSNGALFIYPTAISNDGAIVGSTASPLSFGTGFEYDAGVFTSILIPAGQSFTNTQAVSINRKGEVLVNASEPSATPGIFLWKDGNSTQIDLPIPQATQIVATSSNNCGQIVGYYYHYNSSNQIVTQSFLANPDPLPENCPANAAH